MPETDLSLRKTIIGGETAPDDYLVIWDGLPVGRIFKGGGIGGSVTWSWSAGLPNVPQRSRHRGMAESLPAAKTAFREAWDELRQDLSYQDIQEARKLDADRSRPWHK